MKTTTKSAFHRGFTLIELMIVIVILGILMGTILPRLSGAQGRARDTARAADLNTISQALETYFNDFGTYPGTAGDSYCLNDAAGSPGEELSIYLKGGKIPTPPSKGQITAIAGQSCTGEYVYAPLVSRGVANGGYLLASDVETFQSANYNTSDAAAPSGIDTTTAVADFVTVEGVSLRTVDETDAGATVYILVN